MKPWDEATQKAWSRIQVIAWVMGVSPVAYLIVAALAEVKPQPSGIEDLFLYLLLLIALVQPPLGMLIERFQIGQYRNGRSPAPSPAGLFQSVMIIKFALVNSVFIYGIVIYFLQADFERMLYFYPIGIVWLFIYWPRREKFEKYLQIEKHDGSQPAG